MLEFILAAVGFTFIIIYSTLLEGFRKFMNNIHPLLGKLVECSQCAGFYSGMIVKILLMLFYGSTFTWLSPIIIILYGFISSFVSFAFYLILKKYTNM